MAFKKRFVEPVKMPVPSEGDVASAMLSGVILDTETTGLSRDDSVLSVAILDALTGATLFYSACQPLGDIHPAAQEVHKLPAHLLAFAVPFESITPALMYLFATRTVIAYNAAFDRRLMEQTFTQVGLLPPKVKWLCAMKFLEKVIPCDGHLSLERCAAHYGISYSGAHHAVQDCRITAACLRRALINLNPPPSVG